MSTKEKLIERFKRLPKDFTFDELTRLFGYLGFKLDNKGATSGSRVRFRRGEESLTLHKPHPSNIMKEKSLLDIYIYLTMKGLL
ncbi:MAG: type II toxin-antitoxin system HicA family toxin [Bacteroidales bacterium]|nr:type II toxin-antitoxin system HicA family toxin [Bacteroidales bacterium]MBR1578776.1 type II toxin-antitoxin system HicA family toxin [Bacteroidales bacterium]